MKLKKVVTVVTDYNTGRTSKPSWELTSNGKLWVLSHAEALELYDLLDKALTVVTNVEVPTMTPSAIEWAKCGDWDGKLRAIKEVRASNSCTLLQAKELVEDWMIDNGVKLPQLPIDV